MILDRQPQVVVLECSAIPDFEYTALQRLATGEEKLRDAGIELWLAGLNTVPLATVKRSQLGTTLGDEGIFLNAIEAVNTYEERYSEKAL